MATQRTEDAPTHAELTATGRDIRQWMASGACQSPSGAFCAWREEDSGELAFEYPEITGYALTYLAAGEPSRDELHAARAAADWLLGRLGDRGDLSARDGWDEGATYNFDVAMIAAGLLNAAPALGDDQVKNLGHELARFLADQVSAEGTLAAIPGSGQSPTGRSGWSVDGLAHMLKALQALALAGDQGEAAQRLADSAGRYLQDDGRFVTEAADSATMLHPHLYTVEGLWCWGTATGDEQALAAARSAAEWVWRHQLPSGGLPRYVETGTDEPGPEQLDLTGQGIRMAVALGVEGPGPQAATARLTALARENDDGKALPYQPDADPVHLNCWVSMFGGQALEWAGGSREIAWQELV